MSIDDHELVNLRQMMNEIFGEENFVATVIWQKVYSPKSSAKHFSVDHDYIVIYALDAEVWRPELLPRTEEQDNVYQNPDNDARGRWRPNNLAARNYYSKGTYPITTPSGRFIPGPPRGSYWRVSEEKFKELDRDGRIWWGENGNNIPAPKIFLSEVKQGRVPQTIWDYKAVGHNQEAKKELLELVQFERSEEVFDTPKPSRLIKQILEIGVDGPEGHIIMDFFAGSGTTAQAIIEQNVQDGGNRQFILVQIPEPTGSSQYPTIADITKERIRSVIKRITQEDSGKLPLDYQREIDLGFRVFRYSPSNYKPWEDYSGNEVAEVQRQFSLFEVPLVEDWREDDLLIEVMLLQGFPLDSRIETLNGFSENTVQRVTSDFHTHTLTVCLDSRIADTTVDELDLESDDVFVCLDSALTDESKFRLRDRCNLRVI